MAVDWLWVDAYDPNGDNVYTQSRTGLLLPYDNWGTGEPNGRGQCGYINMYYATWDDTPCSVVVPIICEYDII